MGKQQIKFKKCVVTCKGKDGYKKCMSKCLKTKKKKTLEEEDV